MIAKLLVQAIKSYQLLSRALHFRTCRFDPSCSQYAVEAIEKHGPFRGCRMAILRILRCSPFSQGGYDPVR